jgi:murein hydrolase activator
MMYHFSPGTFCKRVNFILLVCVLTSWHYPLNHGLCANTDVESLRRQEQQLIEQKIEQNRIKIQRLQSGIEDQKEGFERTQLKEKGVLAELEELDLQLLKMAERLEELRGQMEMQQKLIITKEAEVEKVRDKSMKVQLHMQKRIGAYYKLGKIDLINITFSTQTLPDLLRFHDSFETLIKYDQDLMKRYKRAIEELESARKAYTLEQGLLEEFITQANAKEKEILQARQEKAQLLKQITNQASLHKQAIDELQQATLELSKNLLTLKQKEKLVDQGFLLNKGNHIAPVDGVVTSLFMEERHDQFGIKKQSPGIVIAAPDGSKIRSIFTGRVVYSGYLKGYGNTIIIDHGYDYYTITSRIERILVKKGDIVRRNSTIGIMGSTATILDEGLYFEIRLNDASLDPLKWLNADNLHIENKQPAQVLQLQQAN